MGALRKERHPYASFFRPSLSFPLRVLRNSFHTTPRMNIIILSQERCTSLRDNSICGMDANLLILGVVGRQKQFHLIRPAQRSLATHQMGKPCTWRLSSRLSFAIFSLQKGVDIGGSGEDRGCFFSSFEVFLREWRLINVVSNSRT